MMEKPKETLPTLTQQSTSHVYRQYVLRILANRHATGQKSTAFTTQPGVGESPISPFG